MKKAGRRIKVVDQDRKDKNEHGTEPTTAPGDRGKLMLSPVPPSETADEPPSRRGVGSMPKVAHTDVLYVFRSLI